MAEGNGNRETRLDRIERALELFIADHEQFRADHEQLRADLKQLLTAQVLQKDAIDNLVKVTQEHSEQIAAITQHTAALDTRVDKLVSAIGELISRIPPENLKPGSPGLQ